MKWYTEDNEAVQVCQCTGTEKEQFAIEVCGADSEEIAVQLEQLGVFDSEREANLALFPLAKRNGWMPELVLAVTREERVMQGKPFETTDYVTLNEEQLRDKMIRYFELETEANQEEINFKDQQKRQKDDHTTKIGNLEIAKAKIKAAVVNKVDSVKVSASWEKDFVEGVKFLVRRDTKTVLQMEYLTQEEAQTELVEDESPKPEDMEDTEVVETEGESDGVEQGED